MQFFSLLGMTGLDARMRKLSERFSAMADEVLAGHSIHVESRCLPLLSSLLAARPQSVSELAASTGQRSSTVTQQAARLIRQGWVRGLSDTPDGPVIRLDLTPKAEWTLQQAEPLTRAFDEVIEQRCGTMPATLDVLETQLDASLVLAVAERAAQLRRSGERVVPFRRPRTV